MDTGDLNLPAYKYQLEQVEIALKAKPDDTELLKLKTDLEEVIQITAELIGCDPSILNSDETGASSSNYNESASSSYASSSQSTNTAASAARTGGIRWKPGDRCLAPWNEDGKYYECTIEDVLDDGTCTIVFDGYEAAPLTVIRITKLKPFDRTRTDTGDMRPLNRAKTKRELEQRLRELKRRKRDKKLAKQKEFDEAHEKDKKRWTDFNSKLASRTWKGVVSKSMVKTDKRTEQLRGTTNGYLVSNYKPAVPRP